MPYDYPFSVAAAIQTSLFRLPTHAVNILRLFSHLDSSSIPHAIIERAAERRFRSVQWTKVPELNIQTLRQAGVLMDIFYMNGKWSEVAFNDLITPCLQCSLLRLTNQGGSKFYSMHVLVQSYLRAKVDPIRGHRPGSLVVRLLGSSSTFSTDHKHLAFNRLLLPHLQQIHMEDVVEAGDHASFGHVMERTGDDDQLSVLHLEKCVEIWKSSFGDDHENTLRAMGNLAISYKQIASFQKALELEEKVLDVVRRRPGAEQHNALIIMGNLAVSYSRVGKHEEAVELGKQVLEAKRLVLGPEEVDTVMTMANLAVSYKNLGQNREALELEEEAFRIQKRIVGVEDPDVLQTMSNLAASYRIVGRKEEALELNSKAVELQKRVLGDENPDTLFSIVIRLQILRDLGMKEELMELLRFASPAHERALGVDHQRTSWFRGEFETELALLQAEG